MFLGQPLFLNPYHGKTFCGFLLLFIERLLGLITGGTSLDQLASDEIQVFVLVGVAVSSALIGTFLVLRKMTMLANSLSHTILMGIVLAFFLSSLGGEGEEERGGASMEILIFAALVTGFLTALLTELLTKKAKLQEDASTGLVFTSLFALGVILVTVLTRNAHIGTEAVMGNADALHRSDLFWVALIAISNIFICILFFKEYKLTTFDPGLAFAMGFSPVFFNYLLMAQVSATTITSFRAVGVLLVLAFMTAPSLAARLLTHRLSWMLAVAVALGSLSSLFGVALTRHLYTVYGATLSTSGVVVCVLTSVYLSTVSFVLFKKWNRKSPILRIGPKSSEGKN